jgi:hypothetical protein
LTRKNEESRKYDDSFSCNGLKHICTKFNKEIKQT